MDGPLVVHQKIIIFTISEQISTLLTIFHVISEIFHPEEISHLALTVQRIVKTSSNLCDLNFEIFGSLLMKQFSINITKVALKELQCHRIWQCICQRDHPYITSVHFWTFSDPSNHPYIDIQRCSVSKKTTDVTANSYQGRILWSNKV